MFIEICIYIYIYIFIVCICGWRVRICRPACLLRPLLRFACHFAFRFQTPEDTPQAGADHFGIFGNFEVVAGQLWDWTEWKRKIHERSFGFLPPPKRDVGRLGLEGSAWRIGPGLEGLAAQSGCSPVGKLVDAIVSVKPGGHCLHDCAPARLTGETIRNCFIGKEWDIIWLKFRILMLSEVVSRKSGGAYLADKNLHLGAFKLAIRRGHCSCPRHRKPICKFNCSCPKTSRRSIWH